MPDTPPRMPVLDSTTRKHLEQKVFELETAINSFGIRIELHHDFELFRSVITSIPEKGSLTALFDTRQTGIDLRNGFWIQAVDAYGHTVHIQAIRFDDLKSTTLDQHWRSSPLMFAPAGYNVVLEKCDLETIPAARKISGKVCYHGDFWLDIVYRKLELAPFLSKYATLQALCQFTPDYIYGLVPPSLVERGWPARQGYLHMHPWAPRWHVKESPEFYDDYLVWITGNELLKLWTTNERNIDVLGRIHIANNSWGTIAKHVRS